MSHRCTAPIAWPLGRYTISAVAAATLITGAIGAYAATPEQRCQRARYNASAKYAACQQKVAARYYWSDFLEEEGFGKCTAKYTATWPRLATTGGAPCTLSRYVDNGDGTVADNLSGLQWEQKTDDATLHDKDNVYSWSAPNPDVGGNVTAADGTAFTIFLATVNSGPCFAGQCDWRLPTLAELQTIAMAPYRCPTSPCIDSIFGPTAASYEVDTWSATTHATQPNIAWVVNFDEAFVGSAYKLADEYVRAVRAGL